MNKAHATLPTRSTTVPSRLAAVLAISAGLLTGAFWPVGPLGPIQAQRTVDAAIDPAIPSLTIVAKKLSAAEKRDFAKADALAASAAPADGSPASAF